MSERADLIEDFLEGAGWAEAKRSPVPGDASTRRYMRLSREGGAERAILMDAPMQLEGVIEPDGATAAERQALGYNATARLAGSDPAGFAALASALKMRGFSAPEIYKADMEAGLILLEDFGGGVYAPLLADNPLKEAELYSGAVECLGEIYRSSFPEILSFQDQTWRVRDYDKMALLTETELYLDWYAKDMGADINATARAEWTQIWTELFETLSAHAPGLALRDFHAENLFWLPERESVARVGLIDFQDALFAHPAYDLVSLLEDARRDVSKHLVDGLIGQFCAAAKISDDESFRRAYAVMGAQRNAKILGIFVRLSERDLKPAYRALIPRVKAHFSANLAGQDFADLRQWIDIYMPEGAL